MINLKDFIEGKRKGFGYIGGFIFALMVMSIIILGFTAYYNSTFINYSVTPSGDLNSSTRISEGFSKLNNVTNVMGTDIRSSNSNPNTFIILFTGAFGAIFQTFTILDIVLNNFLGGSAVYLSSVGIDLTWLIASLIALIAFYFTWHMLEGGINRPF